MKATIYAMPQFQITFTKSEIDTLMRCGRIHYDGVCQSFTRQGGFLYGWNNCLTSPDEKFPDDEQTVAISCTSRELNTCIKILEMPPSDVAPLGRALSSQLSNLYYEGIQATENIKVPK